MGEGLSGGLGKLGAGSWRGPGRGLGKLGGPKRRQLGYKGQATSEQATSGQATSGQHTKGQSTNGQATNGAKRPKQKWRLFANNIKIYCKASFKLWQIKSTSSSVTAGCKGKVKSSCPNCSLTGKHSLPAPNRVSRWLGL